MAKQIKITVHCEKEKYSPESAEKKQGYVAGFAETVRTMCSRYNSPWGWCTACVTVTLPDGRSDVACLGECSYQSDIDFIQNSGYFVDMVNEAIAGAAAKKI